MAKTKKPASSSKTRKGTSTAKAAKAATSVAEVAAVEMEEPMHNPDGSSTPALMQAAMEQTTESVEALHAQEAEKAAEKAGAEEAPKKRGRKKAEPAADETAPEKETAPKKRATRKTAAKSADAAKSPMALLIMDGFGFRTEHEGNAVWSAKTPRLDTLMAECPHTLLGASGMDVGLPDGQMGNSEVGHTNIGAGRVVYQPLTRITKSIMEGDFFENPALLSAIDQVRWFGSTLHVFGLMSDGGVHSHIEHICALLDLAKENGVDKVCFHCFMDGRDTPPTSGINYVKQLLDKIHKVGIGCIATIEGRYYAMDRDNRWDRVERAYNAIVRGKAPVNPDPIAAMQASYDAGVTDEFIEPVIITEGANIQKDDAVIFANFRPDRAREMTRAIVDPAFTGFDRPEGNLHVKYVCMAQYDASMPGVEVAYPPQSLANTFGEYISKLGMKQLRIAETEKYAHVTFFFNGGVETEYEGEDRVLVKSPAVATYDLQPEMSAYQVTDEVIKRINEDKYDVIILNFANCDMVGHTGNFDATVKAVEAVDTCIGKVVDAITAKGGKVLITADHGNADQMLEDDGVSPFTAHSTNPVPLILVGGPTGAALSRGVLADLTPTMLDLMGLEQPEEMTGHSLVVR